MVSDIDAGLQIRLENDIVYYVSVNTSIYSYDLNSGANHSTLVTNKSPAAQHIAVLDKWVYVIDFYKGIMILKPNENGTGYEDPKRIDIGTLQ